MSRLQAEMAHMLKYLSESRTSFLAWKEHFEDKAQRLANWDPDEYSQLPMMLSAELQRLASSHSQHKQREQATRSGNPARGRSDRTKDSISRLFS